jgi:hypothetical protein
MAAEGPRLSVEHAVNGANRTSSPPVQMSSAEDGRRCPAPAAVEHLRPDAPDADGMARFFEHLGHRVVRTPGAYWYDFYRGFYVSFPHARLIDPRPAEVRRLFRRALGVRSFGPPEAEGRPSYDLMCRDREYDLGRLSANARSKIRRGLSRCTVERLEPAYVRASGRTMHEETLQRIGIREPYPWETYWRAVERSDVVEVWGALAEGQLAAYLVAVRADRCAEIMVARSSTDALRFYPNNALVYTAVRDLLGRPGIDAVWFGAESLEGAETVDEFKLSMGFVKRPIRQQILLHPLARPLFRSALVMRGVAALAARQPRNELWRKLQRISAFSAP